MPRPHVLLVHCHDLGRHLGAYGVSTVNSPRLDAFAADAVVADRMFTTAPQCSPSRSGLFTGRYPHCNGVLGLTHDGFDWDLHADEQHIAARMQRGGYRTELIGMHHESHTRPDPQVAERLGFDYVRTGGLADEVVGNAVEALDRCAADGRPFYLQVGFTEPHRLPGRRDEPGVMGFLGDHIEPDDSRGVTVPGYLADTESAREEFAELQGAIRLMDDAVGRVLDHLDRLGLTDETITIFTTDHGLAVPRAKCSLYDPGLEVAFMVRWPGGGWTGGSRLNDLLLNLDIVPTLVEALGLDTDGPQIHGRSFLPLLTGRTEQLSDRPAIFGEITYHDYYDPRRSVRTDRFKLIANFSSAPLFMDPSQSWLRRCTPVNSTSGNIGSHPSVELYDLADDPLELTDLADDPAHAGQRAELAAMLATWMADTADPLLAGAVTSPLHRATIGLLQGSTAPESAGVPADAAAG
jgi:arylsulfatase A-like enzyme